MLKSLNKWLECVFFLWIIYLFFGFSPVEVIIKQMAGSQGCVNAKEMGDANAQKVKKRDK